MKVCDEKIIKLKERIKSELPVYSQEQIIRSREVRLESLLNREGKAEQAHVKGDSMFNSPLKEDALRKVFKDQTERAILKSKQISNLKMEKTPELKYKTPHADWKKNENDENKKEGVNLSAKFENNMLKSKMNMIKTKVIGVQIGGEGERIVMKRNLVEKEEHVPLRQSADKVMRVGLNLF
jgi:hypothetical protein